LLEKRVIKIAFCGKMGAGKTQATYSMLGLLADQFGQDNSVGFVIKFAQPLYNSLIAFHRYSKGKAERTFMQRLGDLARREFGDNVLDNIFRENVEGLITNKLPELTQENVLIMTDDLRFLTEYELLKEMGFCIIRVEASEEVRKERLGETFTNIKHRSEVEQELFVPDFVIDNSQSDTHMAILEAHLKHLVETQNLFGDM
jgi:dephospho-CoA kinase